MVARARQGLACSGSAAEANLPKKPTSPTHFRGRAISPKAPRRHTRTATETDYRRGGPLGDRSLPQKLIGMSAGADRSEIDPYLGGCLGPSGSGSFLETSKPHVQKAGKVIGF